MRLVAVAVDELDRDLGIPWHDDRGIGEAGYAERHVGARRAGPVAGPLFNLSGQVLGLSIGYGTSRAGDGYVVPIDSALRIARQIAGQ